MAEVLTQTPSCYQNGGESTTETSHPFLKRALRQLLANPEPALPVAGSCACRVARMAILLHFISPGRTALGVEATAEKKKRLLHGLCSRVAATGSGSPPMRAFGVHLPASSAFTASEGWGLPSWY